MGYRSPREFMPGFLLENVSVFPTTWLCIFSPLLHVGKLRTHPRKDTITEGSKYWAHNRENYSRGNCSVTSSLRVGQSRIQYIPPYYLTMYLFPTTFSGSVPRARVQVETWIWERIRGKLLSRKVQCDVITHLKLLHLPFEIPHCDIVRRKFVEVLIQRSCYKDLAVSFSRFNIYGVMVHVNERF